MDLNSNFSSIVEDKSRSQIPEKTPKKRRNEDIYQIAHHTSEDESRVKKMSEDLTNVELFAKDRTSFGNVTMGSKNSSYFVGERMKILEMGIKLYKKFYTNLSLNSTEFDPRRAHQVKPEKCGYAVRLFRVDSTKTMIECIDSRGKVETKIRIREIKRILIPADTKKFLKEMKEKKKTEMDIKIMLKPDFIPFSLVVEGKGIDLIAQSYQEYLSFSSAISELIKARR